MSSKSEPRKNVGGDDIQINIGDNAHNVVAGKEAYLHQINSKIDISEMDLVKAKVLFSDVEILIEKELTEKKVPAKERLKELEETIFSKQPELSTIEYVVSWFRKNAPQLAGAVVSVLVNPIIGKIVEATGELAAEEIKKRIAKKE